LSEYSYYIFEEFIQRYLARGFLSINRNDPFIKDMEDVLRQRDQIFYIADVVRLKIFFVSKGFESLIGVKPNEFDLSTFIDRAHPDDKKRYALARVKYIKTGQDMFVNQTGAAFLSTNCRIMDTTGKFAQMIFQGKIFYSQVPYPTAFSLLVITSLPGSFKVRRKGYHFYLGQDESYFRYPDSRLLQTGIFFTRQEFEILKLISTGCASDEIAEKLLLTVNTVNTHRRNILKKTKTHSTHELIIGLQQKGVL
jgi:DNA-binding CsgD family transcriptional regulator